MIIGTFSLRVILVVILKMLAVVAGFLLMIVCGLLIYLGYLGYLGYLEPRNEASEPFIFEPGQKRFEIGMLHDCDYIIVVNFSSSDENAPASLTLGNESTMNLPAKADIFLYDEHGQMVFSKTDFGGNVRSGGVVEMTYAKNSMSFYVGGTDVLARGRYTADIHIKQTDIDISHLDAKLYIFKNTNDSCREGLKWEVLNWYWLLPHAEKD